MSPSNSQEQMNSDKWQGVVMASQVQGIPRAPTPPCSRVNLSHESLTSSLQGNVREAVAAQMSCLLLCGRVVLASKALRSPNTITL
jgi:hypothetical protein